MYLIMLPVFTVCVYIDWKSNTQHALCLKKVALRIAGENVENNNIGVRMSFLRKFLRTPCQLC